MLHASLEDVLRSMEKARFLDPAAPPERFVELKVPSFDVKELLPFRGKSVADIQVKGRSVDAHIEDAVESYLDRSNYNSTDQVAAIIERHGLDIRPLRPHLGSLSALMRRRHRIAHRADQNPASGRGHHQALPLLPATARAWRATVEAIGSAILGQY